jgi:hypothetical protein
MTRRYGADGTTTLEPRVDQGVSMRDSFTWRRLAVAATAVAVIGVLAIGTAAKGAGASTTASPHFTSAAPTFHNPKLRVAFRIAGVPAGESVTVELTGERVGDYSCADGSTGLSSDGPIFDPLSGGPYGAFPPEITVTASSTGVATGWIWAVPMPPASDVNPWHWHTLQCANLKPAVLTTDLFEDGGPGESFALVDTTDGITAPLSGVYGYPQPPTGLHTH